MTFKYLNYVQSGFLSSQKFNRLEITKRCYSLNLSSEQEVESVHTSGINTLDIEKAESRYLLSGCSDGSIYIHDVINLTGNLEFTAKCICKILKNNKYTHRCSVECVSWYGQDSDLFITSGSDRTLKVWDSQCLKSIENYNLKGRIYHHDCSLTPSTNPIIAVASSVNYVELIDLRTGSSTHELRGHKSSILACNWSPTEEYLLATGSTDKSILLWDIRSSNSCLTALDKNNQSKNEKVAHSGFINGLKFTADGLFLVSIGTDNKIRLWEALRGSIKKKNFIEIKNDVNKNIQFAISNNSHPPVLYIPSEGKIFVVDLFSGALIKILNGHFNLVNCCFYKDVFQELYSAGNDRNILLWTPNRPLDIFEESKTNKPCKSIVSKTLDDWSSDEN